MRFTEDRLNRLKSLNLPASIIESEERRANEYNTLRKEYIKNNPIQEPIVNEIYKRESELEYNRLRYTSYVEYEMDINPLDFMNEEDYEYNIYKSFLSHAFEIYRERYKEDYNRERYER